MTREEAISHLKERGTQYRLIYLPEKDLMPYDDLSKAAAIQDATDDLLDQWQEAGENSYPIGLLRVSREWARIISMALTAYKAVLLNVHEEQFRRELNEAESLITREESISQLNKPAREID